MRRLLAAVLIASLLCGAASATTLVLKKGGARIEGEIVYRDDKEIRLRLKDGKVQSFKVADIDHLEEPPPPPVVPKNSETGDAKVDSRTKDYEKRLGFPLAATLTELTVVRGDQPIDDLKRIGDAAQKTVEHFCKVFACRPEETLVGERYGPSRVEILQFVREEAYGTFCDKVLAHVRDSSVDDARLALMKRQRGFWIVTPRSLMAQYQGPSDLVTSISAAVHKTSHICLEGWKPAGEFRPWWLYEGLATWQEFAVLGETRTYCVDLERPDAYGRAGAPAADEEKKAILAGAWKRFVKRGVEKHDDKELGALAKLSLNELNFPDVQQSWSVVDWLDQTARLKDFVQAYKEARDLAPACDKILKASVAEATEQWRAWVLRTY